ncbi:hypothetical protein H0H93_013019 [Arthromyces matolae]|nr:hypothetical protein H0H93_013019 [Arthromyces matolae]
MYLAGRTKLAESIKKSAWTTAEDELLLSLYTIHGTKWSAIAREIPGRTDDACSKRYREALDPALKKDEWTSDEDKRLMELFHEIGGKWGQVGQELQRSGLACRNRHRLLLKRQTKLSYESLADEGPFAFSRTIDSLEWPLIDPSQLAEAYPPLPDKEAHCSDINFRSPTPDVFSGTPNAPPFRFLSSSLNTALPIGHRSLPAIPEAQESTSLLSNEAEHLLLNLSVQEEEMAKNDAPINFMAGTDLSQIFLGVHFDDNGVFQYPGSANASPVGVLPQLEAYTWPSSSMTEPMSSPTSVHGHLATDTIPSTLSTPYDFPLSLSGTSSPNVSSPIDLAANELQLNLREASPQRRSPRTKRRKGNNTGISEKPLRLSSSLALTTE